MTIRTVGDLRQALAGVDDMVTIDVTDRDRTGGDEIADVDVRPGGVEIVLSGQGDLHAGELGWA